MEIILKTDIPKLGKALDIVVVKDGYARNFLFPRKMAIMATPANKEMIEKNRAKMEALFANSVTENSLGKNCASLRSSGTQNVTKKRPLCTIVGNLLNY